MTTATSLETTPLARVRDGAAFALSALLSPYLVIPAGTFGIVANQTVPAGQNSRRVLLLWSAISVFFSTVIPALYVVAQVLRGKITDVHVMEREQREAPFLVAILSAAIGSWVVKLCGAPYPVWSLNMVLAINGVVLLLITTRWKISMHVSVLSATVLAVVLLIPNAVRWPLLLLIPALIWARVTRKRHSIWQGIGGCGVAAIVTATVLWNLGHLYNMPEMWPALTQR